MDIFTTALTKVRATPIKPEKLRVKSLQKDAEAKALSDDLEHLEDHELYFVKEKQGKSRQEQTHDKEAKQHKPDKELSKEEAIEPTILHKQDLLHPKKHDDEDDNVNHLDIYV